MLRTVVTRRMKDQLIHKLVEEIGETEGSSSAKEDTVGRTTG